MPNKKILSVFLMLAIFFSDLVAMDDKSDENVVILRSGRKIPKITSVSSNLQLQNCLSQVGDDEGQVRKRRRVEEKEEESRPVEMSPAIPPVAQGYEEIYQRFLNGALIYKPDPNSDVGMVTFLIRELANPLEGTFDLSRCGDSGKYLSISTGYRKGKKAENRDKVEIWFVPRFLVEKELDAIVRFKPIFSKWSVAAPIGIFWTRGDWDEMSWSKYMYWYDYLISQSMEEISNDTLYVKWLQARSNGGMRVRCLNLNAKHDLEHDFMFRL